MRPYRHYIIKGEEEAYIIIGEMSLPICNSKINICMLMSSACDCCVKESFYYYYQFILPCGEGNVAPEMRQWERNQYKFVHWSYRMRTAARGYAVVKNLSFKMSNNYSEKLSRKAIEMNISRHEISNNQ